MDLDRWIGVEHPRTAPHWPECRCLKCATSELSLSLAREQRLRFLVGEIRTLLEGDDDPDVTVALARNIVYDALSSVPDGEES